jgi:putative endonuclease
MYFVYVLQSLRDKRLYTGMTGDVSARCKDHSDGRVESTRNRRPLRLIYYEAYVMKQDAQKREAFLKTSDGKRLLRKQLTAYLSAEGEIQFEE